MRICQLLKDSFCYKLQSWPKVLVKRGGTEVIKLVLAQNHWFIINKPDKAVFKPQHAFLTWYATKILHQ